MKIILASKLFIGYLLISISANAQEKTLDCKYNLQEAVFYLKGSEFVKKDPLKAIEYLKPCVAAEFADAQLLMGRIFLNRDKEDDLKKGYRLIQKAAKQGNAAAACDLGVLYKYGNGCKLNLNKAKRWFRKAYNLGSDKGAYSLGYMYYKGLGSIEQDYTEAARWFKSDYQMAKYWLGVSYYFGYGVPQNSNKAKKLLKDSSLKVNDKTGKITKTNSKKNKDSNVFSSQTKVNTESNKIDETKITIEEFTPEKLNGKWIGTLNQLDWSGTKIEQSLPISIHFSYNSQTATTNFTCIINGQEVAGEAINDGSSLYFEKFYLNLNHLSFSAEIPENLDYQILSSSFTIKSNQENYFLTASIDSYVNLWEEPGAPISLVLTKKGPLAENGKEITEETLQALAIQKDSFIKLYPNPFQSDLLIAYTLENKGYVSIKVSGIDGSQHYIVEQGKYQKSGDYTYHFDGSKLKNGIYAISIVVNGVKENKLIIKE